jgi:hypothetical protein
VDKKNDDANVAPVRYSDAMLDSLESQNDEHVGVLTSKVKMLKDVRSPLFLTFISPSSLYPSPLHSTFLFPKNTLLIIRPS